MKRILFNIFLGIFTFSFFGVGSYAMTSPQPDHDIKLIKPFTRGGESISTEKGSIGIVEQYISKIFVFGGGLVTIVAVIWILIGGYEIMFRGSFAGSVEEGKTKITHALLGITLLLLSGLILNMINPGFFTLGGGSAVKTENEVVLPDKLPDNLPQTDSDYINPDIPGSA